MTLIEIYHIFQDKSDHFTEKLSELNAMQYLASGQSRSQSMLWERDWHLVNIDNYTSVSAKEGPG